MSTSRIGISLTTDSELSQLITCPIMKSIIRHPVTASDGRTYEASALLKHFQTIGKTDSPFNRKPITDLVYNIVLKNVLDEKIGDDDERHEDYDKDSTLLLIEQYVGIVKFNLTNDRSTVNLQSKFSPVKSAYFSLLVAAGIYILLENLSDKTGYYDPNTREFYRLNTPAQNITAAGVSSLIFGFLDYGVRVAKNHAAGIPETIYNMGCGLFSEMRGTYNYMVDMGRIAEEEREGRREEIQVVRGPVR